MKNQYIITNVVTAEPCKAWDSEGIEAEGYKVTYENGNVTWVHKNEFERTYTPIKESAGPASLAQEIGKSAAKARANWQTITIIADLGKRNSDIRFVQGLEDHLDAFLEAIDFTRITSTKGGDQVRFTYKKKLQENQ